MENVNWGILGCGDVCERKSGPPMYKTPHSALAAVMRRDAAKAADFARRHGVPKSYTDADALIADPGVDIVYVATPPDSHRELALKVLAAGKPVYVEKPMAMNYDEARQMLAARDKSGKVLTIGYQNRYRPECLYLKQECEAGTFGDIYYAHAQAIRRRAVPTWGVFIDEEKQGGGPLIDIGTHALDLTLFMMDNYEPDYCVGTTYHALNKQTQTGNAWGDWDTEKFTAEDSAFGFVVMKNGATIYLSSSWALNTLDVREAVTEFSGTKAGADMRDGLRINGVRNGRQYVFKPDFSAGGVAFFDGASGGNPNDLEA